jgi:hypothetical protein
MANTDYRNPKARINVRSSRNTGHSIIPKKAKINKRTNPENSINGASNSKKNQYG